MELGAVGIWALPFRTADRGAATEAIAELEGLGFGTLWIPESGTKVILDVTRDLLAASSRIVVASGILNIWMHEPDEVAAAVAAYEASYPGRFLLGLGASHQHLVEAGTSRSYDRPYSTMVHYLDDLDHTEVPVAPAGRALAALGPRMLKLARDRTAGAHPYCVPVSHTTFAREVLGAGPLLAPELKVVLSSDPTEARRIARVHLHHYFELPNYANNLRRLGWGDDDLDHGGSDKLVDAVVAWGTPEQIAARCTEHLDAGADHVCIQVLSEDMTRLALEEWRRLAPAVLG